MPDEPVTYCAGLPLVTERPLNAAERTSLSRAARARRRRAFGWLFGMTALWLAAASAAVAVPDGRVLTPGLVIAAIVATPVAILLARDDFRLARAMRQGLAAGRVRRFAGVLQPAVAMCDATATRLLSHNALRTDTDAEQTLDVLDGAGLVWAANGERPARWLTAETSWVAPTPDYAATAAEWVEPWTNPEGETTWWNRRDLTAPERQELRTHTRGVARVIPVWLLINVYLIAQTVQRARDGEWAFFAIALAVTVWLDVQLLGILRNVARLRRDMRLGMVAIVRPEVAPEEEGAQPDSPSLGPPMEFLPFSWLLWSHAGQPAPWRKARGE